MPTMNNVASLFVTPKAIMIPNQPKSDIPKVEMTPPNVATRLATGKI